MNEITLVLFIASLGLFIISYIVNKNQINWLTFFTSICSVGMTVTDTTLEGYELAVLMVPVIYVLFMSGWSAWGTR